MAALPAEDIAATLFADVHYYYGPPRAKPPHHRFDKGSYVYLYENAHQRRARLEIANNAGTPDQDAFDGYIDSAHVEYTYKHSNLVTLTVDGDGKQPQIDHGQWHLPTHDPKGETKYLYRLHTVDLYFYAKEDAQLFVNAVRRVLPETQLNLLDEPGLATTYSRPVSHAEPMSPIVQSLEHVAMSDPSYQDGRTRNSRSSIASEQSTPAVSAPPVLASPFPGPPVTVKPFPSTLIPAPTFPGPPTVGSEPVPAPMAYNPAAPAAPEAIIHREKTPPPEDSVGNPLLMAAAQDQGQQFAMSQQQSGATPSPFAIGNYFPGPPQSGTKSPYGLCAIPPPPPPPSTGHPVQSHVNTYQGHSQGQVQHQQGQYHYPNQPLSPGFQSPLASPGLQSTSSISNISSTAGGISSSPPVVANLPSPPPPAGSYSDFSYSRSQTMPVNSGYNVHQQIYRPTEAESKVKHHELPKNPRGKLEDSAVKVEKGVTSFLKKLEKKYG